jgi:hypothetical protein
MTIERDQGHARGRLGKRAKKIKYAKDNVVTRSESSSFSSKLPSVLPTSSQYLSGNNVAWRVTHIHAYTSLLRTGLSWCAVHPRWRNVRYTRSFLRHTQRVGMTTSALLYLHYCRSSAYEREHTQHTRWRIRGDTGACVKCLFCYSQGDISFQGLFQIAQGPRSSNRFLIFFFSRRTKKRSFEHSSLKDSNVCVTHQLRNFFFFKTSLLVQTSVLKR